MAGESTLPRDPKADKRVRDFMQKIQTIINSMLLNDELIMDGIGSFTTLGTENSILVQQVFGK